MYSLLQLSIGEVVRFQLEILPFHCHHHFVGSLSYRLPNSILAKVFTLIKCH